jgi:hypothetical protein
MIEAFKMTEEQFKLDLEKRITAINMILMQEFPSLVHLLAFLRYVIDDKYVLPNRGTVPVPTAATDGFNTWSEIVLNLHFYFTLPTAIDYTHKMDNTSNIRIKFIGCFIKKGGGTSQYYSTFWTPYLCFKKFPASSRYLQK